MARALQMLERQPISRVRLKRPLSDAQSSDEEEGGEVHRSTSQRARQSPLVRSRRRPRLHRSLARIR
eukprot:6196547-Pleurochrysis_carterae.AAC.4